MKVVTKISAEFQMVSSFFIKQEQDEYELVIATATFCNKYELVTAIKLRRTNILNSKTTILVWNSVRCQSKVYMGNFYFNILYAYIFCYHEYYRNRISICTSSLAVEMGIWHIALNHFAVLCVPKYAWYEQQFVDMQPE